MFTNVINFHIILTCGMLILTMGIIIDGKKKDNRNSFHGIPPNPINILSNRLKLKVYIFLQTFPKYWIAFLKLEQKFTLNLVLYNEIINLIKAAKDCINIK